MGQGLIALYHRKLPSLVDGGFDWVDVRDIAKAAIIAMEKGSPGEQYVISGMWKTVKDLAFLVQDVTAVIRRNLPPLTGLQKWAFQL